MVCLHVSSNPRSINSSCPAQPGRRERPRVRESERENAKFDIGKIFPEPRSMSGSGMVAANSFSIRTRSRPQTWAWSSLRLKRSSRSYFLPRSRISVLASIHIANQVVILFIRCMICLVCALLWPVIEFGAWRLVAQCHFASYTEIISLKH